jgi:hypothetical protein
MRLRCANCISMRFRSWRDRSSASVLASARATYEAPRRCYARDPAERGLGQHCGLNRQVRQSRMLATVFRHSGGLGFGEAIRKDCPILRRVKEPNLSAKTTVGFPQSQDTHSNRSIVLHGGGYGTSYGGAWGRVGASHERHNPARRTDDAPRSVDYQRRPRSLALRP